MEQYIPYSLICDLFSRNVETFKAWNRVHPYSQTRLHQVRLVTSLATGGAFKLMYIHFFYEFAYMQTEDLFQNPVISDKILFVI